MLEQALKSGARAHARRDHAGARRLPRRKGGAAVPLHPRPTPTTRAARRRLHADHRVARQGRAATTRSVATLKEILYRGEWWARGRTARIRAAAAARAAQHRPRRAPMACSRKPPHRGPARVRKTRKAALAEPAPPRRRKRVVDPVARAAQLADDFVRRFAAALRGAQLYAPAHPLVPRAFDGLAEALTQLLADSRRSPSASSARKSSSATCRCRAPPRTSAS